MAYEESAELPEPCVGSFDDPSPLVASEFAPVLVASELAVFAVRNDEVDAASGQRTPSGRPPPSTSTIHFVPLPRLVLPTAEPPFWPERSCRPGTSLPTSTVLRRRAHPVTLAMRPATRPALPTASTAASRSPEKDICQAGTATLHPSATPTGCLPDKHGWRPMDALACPCDASAQAAAARSAPTAHRSTTQIASCSCKKFIKPPASPRSHQFEAEPIYETRSRERR